MVLVRRRNEFVGELLRALKQRDVPVAGADRLVLTEQLAVQDLIALGRFLLLPEDDLTLAAVLKGPLFGIDEETLFDLAYGRGEATFVGPAARLAPRTAPALRRAAERLAALARPRRFRAALRALCRDPRRRGRAARHARAARARGGGPDRRVPRAGARL